MSVPKRFGILRFFGTFMKVVAWIFLVLSVLGAISAVLFGSSGFFSGLATGVLPLGEMPVGVGGALGIAGAIGILIAGLLNFLVFYVIGESIHMQLAVEENTRLTAALLLRMHQESRLQEERSAYGDSGFVTEAYE